MSVKIVLDVGAGMWKSYNKYINIHKPYEIIAFEPHPELNKKLFDLKNKIVGTDISEKIIIHEYAVSDVNSNKLSKFYLLNDPVASSLCPLNKNCVRRWKYPLRRPLFRIIDTINVKTITLSDFAKNHKRIKKFGIELLNIDIQGNCCKVLDGISLELYRKIKRIIIKCIDTPFELYIGQSDIVDVIDKLRMNDFALIRGVGYSRGQEKIMEFVNKRFMPSHKEMNPIFNILETGEFVINLE